MANNSSLAVEQMQNHNGRKHGKCEKLQTVPFRLFQTPINVKGCSIVWNFGRSFSLKSISKNWFHICSTTLIWKKKKKLIIIMYPVYTRNMLHTLDALSISSIINFPWHARELRFKRWGNYSSLVKDRDWVETHACLTSNLMLSKALIQCHSPKIRAFDTMEGQWMIKKVK